MEREILLVTPVKDESAHLRDVIRHVAGQTLRPVLWVLVDDHSRDGSAEICREAERAYPWVRALFRKQGPKKRQLGSHIYLVQKEGFDFGVRVCRMERIPYRYVGLLDADMLAAPDYYERLVEEFERRDDLGIASGGVYVADRRGMVRWEESPLAWPRGGARLLSRECFEAIGGISAVNSGDAVSAIRAISIGYRVRQFRDVRVTQLRATSSATGLAAGYYQKGLDDYFLGYSLPYALAKGVKKAADHSVRIGGAYVAGYLAGLIRRIDRIDDPVVRRYCRARLLERIAMACRVGGSPPIGRWRRAVLRRDGEAICRLPGTEERGP
jgi:glycosyltransferase involved in cell wall biosynthesis